MRLAKSLPEIALMRKSGEITTQAFRQVGDKLAEWQPDSEYIQCPQPALAPFYVWNEWNEDFSAPSPLPPQVMKDTRPGMNESHLESIFEHSVKMQGAQWMSYPPVVAGGRRANCLHYITNNRTLQ